MKSRVLVKAISSIIFLIAFALSVHAQVGAVLNLDGHSDYVFIPNSNSLNQENMSWMTWVYSDNKNGIYGTHPFVIGKPYGASHSNPYYQYTITGWDTTGWNCGATVDGTLRSIDVTPSAPFVRNVWTHVACTFNGTDLSIYINGALKGSSHAVGKMCTSCSQPLWIGAISTLVGTYYDLIGKQDEVRIYNKGLSASAINEIYENTKQDGVKNPNIQLDGLVGYWSFDGNALDKSIEGNNGTLQDNAFISSQAIGNASNVSIVGVSDLNITLDGSSDLDASYTGVKDIEIKDGSTPMFNFSHDFTSSPIDFTKVSIEKTASEIVFNFSNQFIPGDIHTIYIPKTTNYVYYCPTSKTLGELSSGCQGTVGFFDFEAGEIKSLDDGSYIAMDIEEIEGNQYYKLTTNSTQDDGGGNGSRAVPEFSSLTAMIGLTVLIGGFLLIRNKNI